MTRIGNKYFEIIKFYLIERIKQQQNKVIRQDSPLKKTFILDIFINLFYISI